MSGAHDEFLELCAAHALGCLDEADGRRLEQHLSGGCPDCAAALSECSAATEMLARSAPPARPPPDLRARVLGAVRSGGREEAREAAVIPTAVPIARAAGRRLSWAWVAAAVLLVGLGWSLVAWKDARDRAASLEERVARAGGEPDAEAEWNRFLDEHPDAHVIELGRTPECPPELSEKARVRAAVDVATRRALVVAEGVEMAPQAVELWTIRSGKPMSEGVFAFGKSGRAMKRIENVGDPTGLAIGVSVEAPGGSTERDKPAGPVALYGTL